MPFLFEELICILKPRAGYYVEKLLMMNGDEEEEDDDYDDDDLQKPCKLHPEPHSFCSLKTETFPSIKCHAGRDVLSYNYRIIVGDV